MTEYAFSSTAACPMPPVPIIDVDLIRDCSIPDAPDPIWENPDLPVPIPPELALGCPPIDVVTSVLTEQDEAKFEATFAPQHNDRDNCFPRLFFNVSFPRGGATPGTIPGAFCFSLNREGTGNAIGDITGSVIECPHCISIAAGSSECGQGLLMTLHMTNIEGGGAGAACGCYMAVYCTSSSSCGSLQSVGPEDHDEAVSSVSSLTDSWEIGDDYECLHYKGLERLVYNQSDLNMYAYYRTWCFDFTGRLTSVSKETRHTMQRIQVVPMLYQITKIASGFVFARPVNSDGTLSGAEVQGVIVDAPSLSGGSP